MLQYYHATFFHNLHLLNKAEKFCYEKIMKFFKQTILINVLGVSIAVYVNSNCKADGG